MDIIFKKLCVNKVEAANDREGKASPCPCFHHLGNMSPHCSSGGILVVTERPRVDDKTPLFQQKPKIRSRLHSINKSEFDPAWPVTND